MEIAFALVCIMLFLVLFLNSIQKIQDEGEAIRKHIAERDR